MIADTDVRGLRFIPGDTEIPGTANLRYFQIKALVKRLLALKNETDILILDLGAGTHQSILDFFLLSGRGIVVSAPAVTAVLNAYVFLKNTVFRLMNTSFSRNSKAAAYLKKINKDTSGPQKLYIPKILPEIMSIDKNSYNTFTSQLEKLRPRLIMNMVSDPKDGDVAMKIRRSCEEYLNLKIEHLGVMYRDVLQETALASRLPIVLYKPQSVLAQAVYRIADKILQEEEDTSTWDDNRIEESFQEAGLEAEIDFENNMDYIEDLLHSGALSQGDLIETVKSQQIEISKLKKVNAFIKQKLTKQMNDDTKEK